MQRILNILFILTLCAVLLAAYGYQYIYSEDPCPLCLLQRFGMLGIAIALTLNLRFGIKVEHYGLAILSAFLGRIVSLRQIGLHVCPSFPSFGEPVFGFDLYVWSFLVFSCSIFSCAVLIIIFGFTRDKEHHPSWGPLEKSIFAFVTLLALANSITTFIECGFAHCT